MDKDMWCILAITLCFTISVAAMLWKGGGGDEW